MSASQTLAELDRRMDILLEQINRADQALEELWGERQEDLSQAVFGWSENVDEDDSYDYESIGSDDDDDSVVTIPYYSIPDYDSDSDTETVVDEWLDIYSTPTK